MPAPNRTHGRTIARHNSNIWTAPRWVLKYSDRSCFTVAGRFRPDDPFPGSPHAALHHLRALRARYGSACRFFRLHFLADPLCGDRRCADGAGCLGHVPDAPCDHAQLPGDRAYALVVRRHPPGNPPVSDRKRSGRTTVLARATLPGLSARQRGRGQAAVRHARRRLRPRVQLADPFGQRQAHRRPRFPGQDRRARLQTAL